MSLAAVCIFREPIRVKDPRKHDQNDPTTWQQPWEEMVDTVREASAYLREKADPALVAYEIDDEGEPTGVVLRYRPEEVGFISNDEERRLATTLAMLKAQREPPYAWWNTGITERLPDHVVEVVRGAEGPELRIDGVVIPEDVWGHDWAVHVVGPVSDATDAQVLDAVARNIRIHLGCFPE